MLDNTLFYFECNLATQTGIALCADDGLQWCKIPDVAIWYGDNQIGRCKGVLLLYLKCSRDGSR